MKKIWFEIKSWTNILVFVIKVVKGSILTQTVIFSWTFSSILA